MTVIKTNRPLRVLVMTMTSKSLPLFFNRTMLEQAGIEEYVYWNYERLPHTLVVGATGSGKSYAAKLLLGRISKINSQIEILDYKAEDYNFLQGCARYHQFNDCQQGLNNFYQSFQTRQEGKDTSRNFRLLVCEEWASFLNMLDKKESEEAKRKLGTLLMLGRSYNYHILVIQQRGDSQYFNTARENFNTIIALGNISKESAAMFGFDRDQMQPVHKQGAGFMLINGTDLTEIQVPKISNMQKLERCIMDAVSR